MGMFKALEGWQRLDRLARLPLGEADLIIIATALLLIVIDNILWCGDGHPPARSVSLEAIS